MPKYLFRIDDIHPRMSWEKFDRLRNLFSSYQVKPLIAVIPDNQDETLNQGQVAPDFWKVVRDLQEQGWNVAMHGYQHKYINKEGGILNLHKGSEFASLPYGEQLEKIEKGKRILEDKGVKTDIFIAPGHSFDRNTLRALVATDFKYVSDGIALWPFKKNNLVWIPQIAWIPRETLMGVVTFCFHPQSFSEGRFQKTEAFIKRNRGRFVNFYELVKWHRNQSWMEKTIFNLTNTVFKPFWYLRFNSLNQE